MIDPLAMLAGAIGALMWRLTVGLLRHNNKKRTSQLLEPQGKRADFSISTAPAHELRDFGRTRIVIPHPQDRDLCACGCHETTRYVYGLPLLSLPLDWWALVMLVVVLWLGVLIVIGGAN